MDFQEKEIKLYLQNLPAMAERLRICGAELTRPRILERNLRMDTPDHSLQKEDRLLRLRKDNSVTVTYKDKAQFSGGIVTRTEIEFSSDNLEVTQKLFEALGYRVVVVYEKYRQVHKLGDVIVTLDELPFGNFIEIESPSSVLITGVSQILGLDTVKGITTNYLGLLERVKTKRKLDFNDLTFENFKNLTISPEDLGVAPADV